MLGTKKRRENQAQNRNKEKIKIRAEINEIKNRKTNEENQWNQS